MEAPAQISVWDKYVEDVLSGEILSCRMVRLACERHRADIERSKDPDWPFEFRFELAGKVIELLGRLVLIP